MRPEPVRCFIRISVEDPGGNTYATFTSGSTEIPAWPDECPKGSALSIVPEDAYGWDAHTKHCIPAAEDQVAPTELDSVNGYVISASQTVSGLRFWEPSDPALYRVRVTLMADGEAVDEEVIETGFRQVGYDPDRGVLLNGKPIWLRGYAQRATNEWAESGIAPEWMKDQDARWIRESNANHIRWMHVAASPADIRATDRQGVICTQPAGDKEKETFGRQWDQRVELMRNVIIAYRNHPSILFWEAGNNVISAKHMREMRIVKEKLDPHGGRFMGCRTINTEETLAESEYVGTMLNRHAARFLAEHGPITETEYSREEAPRRVWDDFTPPDFDYPSRWLGKGGKKQKGMDFYDLTAEELAIANARGYSEFFHDRIGGASGKNLYSACAALCWTDSAQHGRQSWSENGRMSGRVDAIRVKKQSFDVFRVMQSTQPEIRILGHWNYPPKTENSYCVPVKRFNGVYWENTDQTEQRDPTRKTVYCVASYPVDAVVLRVNGETVGRCDQPEYGFFFAFRNVDVTRSGCVEATGLDPAGREICRDRIETAGDPFRVRLTLRTAPGGWRADGTDLAMVDIEIVDAENRVCPLADMRLELHCEGNAQLLGGYNSGRFNGNGRHDSVIHQPFVYAECGTNRILLRSTETPGAVRLTVSAEGLPDAKLEMRTREADHASLSQEEAAVLRNLPEKLRKQDQTSFLPIPAEDRKKYTPETENYCKIMVNGQEPDFRGVRAINRNGAIWGNVLCILERMKQQAPDRVDFRWIPETGEITLLSGNHRATARIGQTHLVVDGEENLMDGAPYVTAEGIPVMEVNAIAAYAENASVQFDDKIGALRIVLKP